MRLARGVALAGALLALLVGGADSAAAHAVRKSGPYEIEMGWRGEPALAGSPNSVEVTVSRDGAPLIVPAGALSVEVSYDGAAVTLPLVPTDSPGILEASLTPTRPGTYAFALNGRVRGRQVAVRASCGDSSFDCVEASAGAEFPVKDPSVGQLAQRLSSESNRVEKANHQADDARTIALFAVVPAAIGLVLGAIALATSIRSRRRGEGEA